MPAGEASARPESTMADWTEAEIREWARRLKACWEFEVVQEMVKGAGVRPDALALNLYAQPDPTDEDPGDRAFAAAWARLREVATRVLTSEEGVHVEIEPFDASARFRPETGQISEVTLTVRFTASRAEAAPDRAPQLRATIEQRLKQLGLRPRAWSA
jgi:hypothetical protein